MNRFIAVFSIAALTCIAIPAQAAGCHAVRGIRITLFGGVDDPDVLVWDSRDRLTAFASGSSDARKFLLPHALLARPGTPAVVQGCEAAAVHSKFRMDAEDAVGVKILGGEYRGRYGWVESSDVHGPGIPESQEQW